jgi:hypothetical protein
MRKIDAWYETETKLIYVMYIILLLTVFAKRYIQRNGGQVRYAICSVITNLHKTKNA